MLRIMPRAVIQQMISGTKRHSITGLEVRILRGMIISKMEISRESKYVHSYADALRGKKG